MYGYDPLGDLRRAETGDPGKDRGASLCGYYFGYIDVPFTDLYADG